MFRICPEKESFISISVFLLILTTKPFSAIMFRLSLDALKSHRFSVCAVVEFIWEEVPKQFKRI